LQRTVVGSILLAADQQLGVEQLAVGTGSDLVDGLCQLALRRIQCSECVAYRWVQVDKDGARDVFAAASLGEEGLERATLREIRRIGVRTAVSLQAMLEKVPGRFVSMDFEVYGYSRTYSSHALFPSWVPAWPMCRWQICGSHC
jgi:hypothetical protein